MAWYTPAVSGCALVSPAPVTSSVELQPIGRATVGRTWKRGKCGTHMGKRIIGLSARCQWRCSGLRPGWRCTLTPQRESCESKKKSNPYRLCCYGTGQSRSMCSRPCIPRSNAVVAKLASGVVQAVVPVEEKAVSMAAAPESRRWKSTRRDGRIGAGR